MRYNSVAIEGIAYALPEIILTSQALEEKLQPLYERLNLCTGRIELMSGIKERRLWLPGTLPSQASARAAENLLEKCCFDRNKIQCLINCSVSRDFVEPATSTAVHSLLNLKDNVINFDISNACLGMASAIQVLADMIEAGHISCGMAVCGENASPLILNTIEQLNADTAMTRQKLKGQFASLTIGSCAAAIILSSTKNSNSQHKLLATSHYSDTSANKLCQGDANGGMTENSKPLMQTDSQTLLHKGVAAAQQMWQRLKDESGWNENTPDIICTHQVGKAHSALLYNTLHLNMTKDFCTYPSLGNCGSASWPATCALAEEKGCLTHPKKLAVLAIGSGINCDGLAIQW